MNRSRIDGRRCSPSDSSLMIDWRSSSKQIYNGARSTQGKVHARSGPLEYWCDCIHVDVQSDALLWSKAKRRCGSNHERVRLMRCLGVQCRGSSLGRGQISHVLQILSPFAGSMSLKAGDGSDSRPRRKLSWRTYSLSTRKIGLPLKKHLERLG